MRNIVRRLAATVGAALLVTVPLVSVGATPASGEVNDELTAAYNTNPYPSFSTKVYEGQEYRQTFQASVTGELTRTRIWLRSEYANYPPGGIPASVSVYNVNADNTLGSLVDSGSATIPGSAWPAPTTDTATFNGGMTLTAGSNYALVVRAQMSGFGSNFYAEMVGSYANGRGYVCTTGTESCNTNYWSTWFEVYVSTVPADTTAPVLNLTVTPDRSCRDSPRTRTSVPPTPSRTSLRRHARRASPWRRAQPERTPSPAVRPARVGRPRPAIPTRFSRRARGSRSFEGM